MSSSLSPLALDYWKAVQNRLRAIPATEREAMLEDLHEHLLTITQADPGVDLHERLGAPTAYADALLESAGAKPRQGFFVEHLDTIRMKLQQNWARRPVEWTWQVATTLKPAWWALRAYIVVILLCAGYHVVIMTMRPVDNPLLPSLPPTAVSNGLLFGTVLLVVAVVVSLMIGRRQYKTPVRAVAVVANLAIAWAGLTYVDYISTEPTINTSQVMTGDFTAATPNNCLRDENGNIISNLSVYNERGELIPRAFVYANGNRPLVNVCKEIDNWGGSPQVYEDGNGDVITNMYPLASSPGAEKSNRYDGVNNSKQPVVPTEIVPVDTPSPRR